MTDVKIFSNEEFGEVRTVIINEEPWFVGKDVAVALGYSNARDALSRHVDLEDRADVVIHDGRQNRNMVAINESGVYSLIFGSKLESAKRFKHWVTNEVLPAIRKTGGYINNGDLFVNTYFGALPETEKVLVRNLISNIEEQQKQIIGLSHENDLLAQKQLEWADRSLINALVRTYSQVYDGKPNQYGMAWTDYKKELLYKHSINLNARITNYLNTTGKKTKPKTLDVLDNSELQCALSTIVSMCREKDLDISDILKGKINKYNGAA